MEVNVRHFVASDDYITAINSLYSFSNHSCVPNVDVIEDELTGSSRLVLKARCDIAPQEELTISYLDDEQLQLGYQERREAILPWTGADYQYNKYKDYNKRRDRPPRSSGDALFYD